MQHDLYKILGIRPTASDEDIKKAFRGRALRFHPDRNQGMKEAEESFKEANYAYSVLGNPEKRRLYDIYCRLFPPEVLQGDDRFADTQIFEKLFLHPELIRFVEQVTKAVEYPLSLWKDWLYRSLRYSSDTHAPRGPWWLSLPFLPIKLAGVTGTFLSARLLRRLGKDFSSSRSYSSHADPRNQDHPGDIEMVLPLTSKEIEDGTSRKVSFLQNGTWVRLNVKVPPGVQPGYRLRLKQKGNTMPGGHGPGDLYLRIAVNQ